MLSPVSGYSFTPHPDRSIPDECSLDLNCYPNKMCHITPNPRHLMGKKQDFLGFPAQWSPHGLAAHPWLSFRGENWVPTARLLTGLSKENWRNKPGAGQH